MIYKISTAIYEKFSTSIDDAVSLLRLSEELRMAGKQEAQLVLESSIVLSVAFWETIMRRL